jgi:hypothetical protein
MTFRPESRWRTLLCLLILSATVAALAAHKIRYMQNVPKGDVVYDLSVARNVAEGRGFSTNLMPLGALQAALDNGHGLDDPWPSLHKFIFAQAALAPLVRVLGESILTARIASELAYGLLVCAMFGLLLRVLRSHAYAFAYAFAFVSFEELNSLALAGVNGTTDVLLFFLAVAAWLAMLAEPKLAWLGGVAVAFCVLDRYSTILLVPFYVLGVWRSAGRQAAVRVTLAALLVLAPPVTWSWLKYRLPFPSPQGYQLLLFRTKYLTYDPWFVTHWPKLGETLGDLSSELSRKIADNIRLLRDMTLGSGWDAARNVVLAVLAALGVRALARERGKPIRVMTIALGGFTLLYVAAHVFLVLAYRYIAFVLPWLWICACLFVHAQATRFASARRPRWMIASVVVLSLVTPEIIRTYKVEIWCRTFGRPCWWGDYCNRDEITAYVGSHYGHEGLVISGGNKPWELALGSHNRVMALLERPEELGRLRSKGLSVDLMYLPSDLHEAGDDPPPRSWLIWDAIREAHVTPVEGLALAHEFSDGSLLYERKGPADAFDYCVLPGVVDVQRDAHRVFLDKTAFRFTERKDEEAWSWILARNAKLVIVGCRGARSLRLRLLASSPESVAHARLNGSLLGTARFEKSLAWTNVDLAIPDGLARDGVNDLELEVPGCAPETLKVAFGSAAMQR